MFEDTIINKLNEIERKIDNLEIEIKKISKHVGFVETLSQSGVVNVISSINGFIKNSFSFNLLRRNEKDCQRTPIEDLSK